MDRALIIGASRGIGAACARHLAARTADLVAVSRSEAVAGRWVRADIATTEGLAAVISAIGAAPLDALLYLGGTWERGAFTEDYLLAGTNETETRRVIDVNLVAPIELCRRLAPNLHAGSNPRVILIGADSADPARATPEVANTASKAGLRGAAASLRMTLAGAGIGVTLIDPANVATDEVLADIRDGRFGAQTAIPMSDLLAVIDCALALSPDADMAEITLVQRRPAR